MESLDAVRVGLEALNSRDRAALERVMPPDGEWRPLLTAGGELERRVYVGPDGMVEYWKDLDALFEGTRFETLALKDLGNGRVLFRGRVVARGRASGVELDIPIWAGFEVSDGRMLQGAAFRTEADAREALARGLAHQ